MVRKLLAENGISESEVTGTGSGGRITRGRRPARGRRSPRCAAAARRAAAPTAPGPAAPASSTGAPARRQPPPPHAAPAPRRSAARRRRRRSGLHGLVPGRRGPDRALLQHAAPHRRAHGAVQGHFTARLHRQRGRLRERRAGAQGLGRALQGRGGVRTHLPSLRRPGHRGGVAGLPVAQRVGGRRLIARPRRGESRDCGRPVPRGTDRARDPSGRRGHAARGGPAYPRSGRAGSGSPAQRRRHRGRDVLHHERRPVRHLLHGARSSTSPRWRSWQPTASRGGRWS